MTSWVSDERWAGGERGGGKLEGHTVEDGLETEGDEL